MARGDYRVNKFLSVRGAVCEVAENLQLFWQFLMPVAEHA